MLNELIYYYQYSVLTHGLERLTEDSRRLYDVIFTYCLMLENDTVAIPHDQLVRLVTPDKDELHDAIGKLYDNELIDSTSDDSNVINVFQMFNPTQENPTE